MAENIPFSKMPKAEQEKLERDAGYGLSRKLLSKEALAHRERLDQSLALDASKRRQALKAFDSFNDSFDSR